jgi:hypothetical protein
MPFIIPFIPLIAAGVGAAAGIKTAAGQQKTQQQGLQDQNAIAQQEMQDKQQIFKQLTDFFSPYLKSGSPFLQNIQSAAAGQNSQQFNNAAGQIREQVGQAGTGYGGGGSMASALANLGGASATSSASNYLQNLLNNEQVKFQAAQGLNSAGSMVGAPQNQPNVSTQLPAQNLGSSIFGAGQLLSGTIPKAPTQPIPPVIVPPTVGGDNGGNVGGG